MPAFPSQSRSTEAARAALLGLAVAAGLIAAAPPARAQQDGEDAPLSAIDWLSKSIRPRPPAEEAANPADPAHSADPALPAAPGGHAQPATAPVGSPAPDATPSPAPGSDPQSDPRAGATLPIETVEVEPLAPPSPEAAGLLPPSVSGLPWAFWGDSDARQLAGLIARLPAEGLPALRTLAQTILLAELRPPEGSTGTTLLLARIDKLLELGALEPAQALMERAGFDDPEIFRRWFDVALLTDRADLACAALAAKPDLAPTMMARVFCLARQGDWNAAALTLETGTALGFLTEDEADLLARFLDPDLFEGTPAPPPPAVITPLEFVIRESLGLPRPAQLPAAFLVHDLDARAGWKARLAAAERLTRTGALAPAQLFALYAEGKPAASGGVWDRTAAIQRLDVALVAGADPAAIWAALRAAWARMTEARLEFALAEHFADRMLRVPVPDDAHGFALSFFLQSPAYETAARGLAPESPAEALALAVARGEAPPLPEAADAVTRAVAQAFTAPDPGDELGGLVAAGRIGEAVLAVLVSLREGGLSDPKEIMRGLSLLRRVGLEDEARRAALEILLRDERG